MADLLTPSRARELLDSHGLAARRSLGQHFLVDPNTVRKIVRLASLGPDDTVLEVGPGLGSLTLGLASEAGRVVAVEVDEAVAGVLREVVSGHPNVEVHVADAMRADLRAMLAGPARLVANLPYNAATPILARVLDEVPEVSGGLVMVQRELGERWTAGPGSKTYGAISVKVSFHATASVVASVPPTVFMPRPKVSSVLVSFERRDAAPVEVDDPRAFLSFVAAAFGHRRKTIHNALGAVGVERSVGRDALQASGIEVSARPEQLSLEDFARLHAVVRERT